MRKIIFLLVVVIATLGFKCDKPFIDDNLKRIAKTAGVLTSRDSVQTTPEGAVLASYKAWPDSTLAAIDAGIRERQNDAVADGFKEELKKPHSFYEIRTPAYPCVPSPEQRIMSFMTGGGWFYDGTEYDQYNPDGKEPNPYIDPATGNRIVWKKDGLSAIYAAELIAGLGTPDSTPAHSIMIACPDESVIKDAVANGADHIWGGNYAYTEENRTRGPYDVWQYFNDTLYHSTGRGHPLYPRSDSLAASSGKKGAPAPSFVTETPAGKVEGLSAGGLSWVTSSNAIFRAVK